jgi:hypothetical protein
VTGQLRVWMRRMAGLFGAEAPPEPHVGPRTRASDFVPRLDFDEPGKTPTPSPALEPMRDARRVTTGGDR